MIGSRPWSEHRETLLSTGLGRFFRFVRLGSGGLARLRRPPIRWVRGDRRSRRRCELSLAGWRKLRLVLRHAGRDPLDIRYLGAAKTKCVAAAGLLLLGRVSPGDRWPYRRRKQHSRHPSRPPIAGSQNHHSPFPPKHVFELWVKDGALASRGRKRSVRSAATGTKEHWSERWYSWVGTAVEALYP